MKKTYSKDELKAKAMKVLAQFPNAKQVYATVDGNIFLMKNRAELHSKDRIYVFDRSPEPKVPEGTKGQEGDKLTKAADIIAFLETADTLEAMAPYADDKRATVAAAYAVKVEALAKELEVKQ